MFKIKTEALNNFTFHIVDAILLFGYSLNYSNRLLISACVNKLNVLIYLEKFYNVATLYHFIL